MRAQLGQRVILISASADDEPTDVLCFLEERPCMYMCVCDVLSSHVGSIDKYAISAVVSSGVSVAHFL